MAVCSIQSTHRMRNPAVCLSVGNSPGHLTYPDNFPSHLGHSNNFIHQTFGRNSKHSLVAHHIWLGKVHIWCPLDLSMPGDVHVTSRDVQAFRCSQAWRQAILLCTLLCTIISMRLWRRSVTQTFRHGRRSWKWDSASGRRCLLPQQR